MGCGQTRDGHTKRGAGHIIQTGAVAEVYGIRITTVFAADAYLQLGPDAPALPYPHFNKLTDTGLIQRFKRISRKDAVGKVIGQKPTDVIAGKTERGLGGGA